MVIKKKDEEKVVPPSAVVLKEGDAAATPTPSATTPTPSATTPTSTNNLTSAGTTDLSTLSDADLAEYLGTTGQEDDYLSLFSELSGTGAETGQDYSNVANRMAAVEGRKLTNEERYAELAERRVRVLEAANRIQEQQTQQSREAAWVKLGTGIGTTATSVSMQLLLTAMKARTERRIAREQLAQERLLLDRRMSQESEINEAREESAARRTAVIVSILNARGSQKPAAGPLVQTIA